MVAEASIGTLGEEVQMRQWQVRQMSVLLVGLILLTGTVACGTTSTSAPPTASPSDTTIACQVVTAIGTSLTKLSNVGANTTVGEVKTVQQQVAVKLTTLSSLVARIPGASGAAVDNLTTANNQLGEALQGMTDSATLGESAPKLQEFKGKVTQAQSAQTKLATALKCSPAP